MFDAASAFCEEVAPSIGREVTRLSRRTSAHGKEVSLSLLQGPPTDGAYLAFGALDRKVVDASITPRAFARSLLAESQVGEDVSRNASGKVCAIPTLFIDDDVASRGGYNVTPLIEILGR